MANVLVDATSLQSIADAIRTKNGTQNTYKPSQMAEAIENIPSGGITPTGTLNIIANGTHDVTNYASAEVNVPTGTTPTGTKQISITQNGTTTEDVSAYANAEITVNVPSSGGGLALIDTINVNAVNGVQIDFESSWFTTYSVVLIIPDLTFSSADWLYVVKDATTGGNYTQTTINKAQTPYMMAVEKPSSAYRASWFCGDKTPIGISPTGYVYWYLYTASKTMTGTIKIYGIE